jgi:hypothetical protein
LHSSVCSQSCAAAVKPAVTVHEPPLATDWHTAVPASVFELSSPQQLWPAGQSQEYRQWNGASVPVHPASVPLTHVPVGTIASVTQQVFDRRSHVAVPAQTGAVYVVQSPPVQAPW